MKLFVVHSTVPGYAREDLPNSRVMGVYTNADTAAAVKLAAGYGASISEVELDHIPKGYVEFLIDVGHAKGIVPVDQ